MKVIVPAFQCPKCGRWFIKEQAHRLTAHVERCKGKKTPPLHKGTPGQKGKKRRAYRADARGHMFFIDHQAASFATARLR